MLVLGYKRPAYAIPFLLIIQLLIPYVVKFHLGLNLNVFNLSVLIFSLVCFIRRKKKNEMYGLRKILILYTIYIIVTTFFAGLDINGTKEYIQNIILFLSEYIVVAYCFCYININYKDFRYINTSIIVCSLVIIVYGIINYITKFNPYMIYVAAVGDLDVDLVNKFMEEQRGIIDGRISSTFIHPLQLGQASLLLFTYILYGAKDNINKLLYYVLLTGLAIMVVLCGSRSAIFPLLICIAFYFRSLSIKKKILSALSIFFAVILIYQYLPEKYVTTIDGMVMVWDDNASQKAGISGSSKEGRIEQFKSALRIVKDREFFGLGNGYVRNYGGRHEEMLGYESFILRETVDGGIIGVFVFCMFYGTLYLFFLRKFRDSLSKAMVHSLFSAFFISILLTGVSYSCFSLFLTFCCLLYYTRLQKI